MQNIHGFDYFPVNFDEQGKGTNPSEMAALQQRAATATDAIFFAHGFRNNEQDATTLYSNFLQSFRAHLARPEFAALAARNYVIAGTYWPSKQFPESFGTVEGAVQSVDEESTVPPALTQKLDNLKAALPEHAAELTQAAALLPQLNTDVAAQDRFAALVMATLSGSQLDSTEGIQLLKGKAGSDIFEQLKGAVLVPQLPDSGGADGGSISDTVSDFDSGGSGSAQSVSSVFGSILGGVDKFLNLTTWYVMKNRAGVVGEQGVAKAVRDLKASAANLRIHLVGHSLGGRMMAACSKALAQAPQLRPESVTLLEAAFSHFGFSPNNGFGKAGYFRDVMEKRGVKGPLLATYSAQDMAVGTDFAVTSRLNGNTTSAIGDENDPYGGIGRNGALKTPESTVMVLKDISVAPLTPYIFQTGLVTCLNGSGGLIKNHGDVTNPNVTYAFTCSLNQT